MCLIILKFFHSKLLLKDGDVESSPGQNKKYTCPFSYCHWNLNSLVAYIMLKVSLLEAYNTIHKFCNG